MKFHSALHCLLVTTFASVHAFAECVPPAIPDFACVGTMPTQAEKEAALETFSKYRQQAATYRRCLSLELNARIGTQSAVSRSSAIVALEQEYAAKALVADEQERIAGRPMEIVYGMPCPAANTASAGIVRSVQPQPQPQPSNQSTPRREVPRQENAAQVSGATVSGGNTFKSACWNHNLNAAELLDCGACEKQYADMLPQLNQLAVAKKSAQLNAFLGDCPRMGK
jgi:hypothetical protein